MIEFAKIRYLGATLISPTFLVPLWPYQMPIEKWPTFCGAGEGFGDNIVPDHIHGVQMAPACFLHDIEWAVTANTLGAFMTANYHFLRNCLALIGASDLSWCRKQLARVRCLGYFSAVSTIGAICFKADPEDLVEVEDLYTHPVVKAKLHRLAMADLGVGAGV